MILGFALISIVHFKLNYYLMVISLLMAIPTFFDAIYQLFNSYESNNTLRFTTGIIAGISLIILAKSLNIIIGFNKDNLIYK